MKYFVKLRHAADIHDLRRKVRHWDEIGMHGVAVSDHLFTSASTPQATQSRHDPMVLLSAAGTLSEKLQLALLVANSGLFPPVQMYRQFAELAVLFGGERIYAGIGAGWNSEEFEAVGTATPPHRERVARLREIVETMKALFAHGFVDVQGEHIQLKQMPLSPSVRVPPRITIGGASRLVLDIAAEFADHMDFDAPSKGEPMPISGNGEHLRLIDLERRVTATWESLVEMRSYFDRAITGRGRDPASVTRSINISALGEPGGQSGAQWIDHWAQTYALGVEDLPAIRGHNDSPFLLFGEPEEVQRKLQKLEDELCLSFIVLPDVPALDAFMRLARSA